MRKKRQLIWFMAGCFVMLLIGSSFAFWSGKIEHTNELKADQVNAKINEIFEQGSNPTGNVEKRVSFKNNSTNASFLRVSYAETWKKENGDEVNVLNNQLNGADVATKNWKNGFAQNSERWQDGGDGWFYYKKILKPGETTEEVLDSITFPDYSGAYEEYKGADYQLYFRMEILQASDSQTTLNSEDVNQKASTTIFGKVAVVNGETVSWK